MPRPRRISLGQWELLGRHLCPTRCHLQAYSIRVSSLTTSDSLITFSFSDKTSTTSQHHQSLTKHLHLHRSHLIAIGPPLSSLITAPFSEASNNSVMLQESFDTFQVIRNFLYCQPIDMSTVPHDMPLVADRWGLRTLFDACFAWAELDPAMDTSLMLQKFIPIMSLVKVPDRFKTFFAIRLALGMSHPHHQLTTCQSTTADSPFNYSSSQRFIQHVPSLQIQMSKKRKLATVTSSAETSNHSTENCSSQKLYSPNHRNPITHQSLLEPHPILKHNQIPLNHNEHLTPEIASVSRDHAPITVEQANLAPTTPEQHSSSTPTTSTPDSMAPHHEPLWHCGTFSIWNALKSQGMLLQTFHYIRRYAPHESSALLLKIVFGELETGLTDHEIDVLLKQLDWETGECMAVVKSPSAQNWSIRAWRLLSLAQDGGLFRSATGSIDVWRVRWKQSCVQDYASLGFIKKLSSELYQYKGFKFSMSIQHRVGERPGLSLSVKLRNGNEQIVDGVRRRIVSADACVIENGCTCEFENAICRRRKNSSVRPSYSYNGMDLISGRVASFPVKSAVELLVMNGSEFRSWVARHQKECGFVVQVRMRICTERVPLQKKMGQPNTVQLDAEGVRRDSKAEPERSPWEMFCDCGDCNKSDGGVYGTF